MYPPFRDALRALSLSLVVFAFIQSAVAEMPGPFAGSYQLTNVVSNGDRVSLTVRLTVINPGVNDIKGGIITLMDSQPHRSLIGSVSTIALLPHLGQVTVSKSFTISSSEYTRWMTTGEPGFEFLVPVGKATAEMPIKARRVIEPSVAIN